MKYLSELLKHLQQSYYYEGPDPRIRDVVYDSRMAGKDAVFAAVRGYRTDGHAYIFSAYQNGATACVVEKPVDCPVPQIVVNDSRSALADLSHALYHSQPLPFPLLGITGTNGKTTMTHLLYQLAESSGSSPALIGTLGARSAGHYRDEARTTPESRDLALLFRRFEREYTTAVFMEVSSHAIALQRIHGLLFDSAVFTNLSRDHLDFHTDMEAYFQTKARLFRQLRPEGVSIVNTGDAYGKRLYDLISTEKTSYAVHDANADFHFSELSVNIHGVRGVLNTPAGAFRVDSPLLGTFNAENICGSIAAWLQLFPGKNAVVDNFPFRPVDGRMEMIKSSRGTAVIDYAHTPDAMGKALKAASRLTGRKRIITVFGCGGDRDREKRPTMGRIAEAGSDIIILTNDNPRREDPRQIAENILSGIANRA
ncbi:MAG: UDP-N-acetylmuramoyl-L-alanyl-D-glutamate--2,6-diaminopimelate ligase [Candidatus Marinimicrobia bacterium]|nr:UDP-N-acetylmuramoyl-L-alanyl-D-glutamate--2,6-diaminopimelate ligase [Candidatus Neomarinimicrobiota bacterium]